jgi:pimeloyl-ACP methyl ester carboxylesterase
MMTSARPRHLHPWPVAARLLVGPWLELFGQAGYEPAAPGWPGDPDTMELARANPDSIANHGIDDVTNHYANFIDTLPARPVIIGHFFGGMIAEKLLRKDEQQK